MTGRGRGKRATQQQPGGPEAGGAGPWQGAKPPQSYAQMGGGGPAAAPPPQVARSAAPSAWGPPAGASARATHRAPSAQPGDVSNQMAQMNLGAPSGQPPPARGNGNGNGAGAAAPVGRGAMRGRRVLPDTKILRTRPAHLASKQGTGSGTSVNLLANYFKIINPPNWVLHQYRVDIAPEEDRTRERKFLLRFHREKLGGYLFDGTVLYTASRLTPDKSEVCWTSKNEETGTIYTLTVRHVGEVSHGDFAYIQVFNLLMRTCLAGLNLQLVGRDYYDAEAKVFVPRFNLEVWPGYKTSIRQHERDILMCIEITHKVMRVQTVLDILTECYKRNQSDYQRDFVREVVGVVILTKYNNKTYRIDDVDWNNHPSNTFSYQGKDISYAQYMEQKYQIKIRDMRQPMLVSRAKARDVRAGMVEIIHLIPEVCFCTGLTDNMRANFQLMKALDEHTKVAPDTRIKKLLSFNERLQKNERTMEQLKKFDMSLERSLVKIPGRIEVEEKILLGGSKLGRPGPEVDWTRDLRSNPMLLPKALDSWVLIVPSKWKRDGMCFVDCLKKAAGGMRFKVGDPDIVEIQRDNGSEYVQALSQVLQSRQPQLVMCAVPNNRADRYSAIKKKCCVDRAVPSQVIQCKNLNDPKKTMSIATKVAIQMNCKIGGAPWSVEMPLAALMVVGFDVCHDTSSKSQSFGAMVASLDKPLTRYFSAITPHNSGEELSHNLALNIVKALRKYQEVNGALPQRILIYRDGVGEGQIPFVVSTEVETIKEKLASAYGSEMPKMTFVIVTKRINTRIFTDNGRNPAPGCIVDDVVTDPEKYDFFLVSQSVRQGTVSPTSYNVIHDGMALPPSRLQRLTYKMCHMYFNWSGTVRVPAQCQYAHKLAFLVGQALHREPSAQLEDLLYFL